MALRKPLVLEDGKIEQIQAGDTLDAAVSAIDVISATNGEIGAITIGMPVYISAADTVKKAQANAPGTKDVIGLVRDASIAAGTPGMIQTDGQLVSANWTLVVGAAVLVAGSIYYLSEGTAGQLTTTAPATGYVVEVGQAFSTTTLDINIRRAIKL